MTIDCRKCEHYYVTWEKKHPHGCKAMGFKSLQMPIQVVRSTTPGNECQAYHEKKRKRKPEEHER